MTDLKELGEYFHRLNEAVASLIEVQHHTLDIRRLYPECKPELDVVDSLTKEALQHIAAVNVAISMECYHLADKD